MDGSRRVGNQGARRAARGLVLLAAFLLLLIACQSCSPAAPTSPSSEPAGTLPAAREPTFTPPEAIPTQEPVQTAAPTAEPITEGRMVELEWPENLRIGESDVIRLALVPTRDGYVARAEFPDHELQTREVPVPRPDGYELYALARLDGVGFEIAPSGDQERFVPAGEEVAWRWTFSARQPGQQRLSVQMRLRWIPGPGTAGSPRESQIFARGLDVRVTSFLGLSAAQAAASGVVGLLLGSGFLLIALLGGRAPRPAVGAAASSDAGPALQALVPNAGLSIETPPGMALTGEEGGLLRALFQQYARLVIENEFLSGYSGARTFLVHPIRPDGMADALTIVKLGPRGAIQQEYENYEAFVKDRLPPVTARIQRPPVTIAGDLTTRNKKTPGAPRRPMLEGNASQAGAAQAMNAHAAMQYTFIAEPGRPPVSLRRALLENPDPALLVRLFETFGPHWWMQRRPYTFRLEQEYDGLLPPHYVLAPLDGVCARPTGPALSEQDDPASLRLEQGEIVFVRAFSRCEQRADGRSLTLFGSGQPSGGRPPLRLRWLSSYPPTGGPARVVATRAGLLREIVSAFDFTGLPTGLPDPLAALPAALQETVTGTRSVIHGDLNLENVLVGPGSLVWLIDFAQTREGHPLSDFAHLESELIAHVLAPRCGSPAAFLALWHAGDPLIETLHALASRCLFDPTRPREYHLARYLACLGALKYQNLDRLAKECLFIVAGEESQRVMS